MKIQHLFIVMIAYGLMACTSGSNGNQGASGDGGAIQISEESLVAVLAQNDSGSAQNSDGGSNGNTQNQANGHQTIKGEPPILGPECDGVGLLPGSNDAAGRLAFGKEIKKCFVKFSSPFNHPVCVASGALNTARTGPPIFNSKEGFVISNATGGDLVADVINYICFDLANPSEENIGKYMDDSEFQEVLQKIQDQAQGSIFQAVEVEHSIGLLQQDNALEEYCVNERQKCFNANQGDVIFCNAGYDECLNKTDCEALKDACFYVGSPLGQCPDEFSASIKKEKCLKDRDNCFSIGGDPQLCYSGYNNCMSQ